ncbi:MAG: tetratricopeptide repeat protein [Anaerolineae bacterium]|nr:tetratricopeptide repeat protein [Phycisphaerae bacterium]
MTLFQQGQLAGLDELCALAIELRKSRRLDEATSVADRAAELFPESAAPLRVKASVLRLQRRLPEAVDVLRRAVAIAPADSHLMFTLADVLDNSARYNEAVDAFATAVRLDPNSINARCGLAGALGHLGRLSDANANFAEASRLRPAEPTLFSNVLFGMLFDPDVTPAALEKAHGQWWERFGRPLASSRQRHANDRSPDRVLRVGYVSPNFREHPIAFFIEPVLAAHRADQVHAICYSDVLKHDATTARIRSRAHGWRETANLDDAALDQLIRQDRIDILVDLTQHMARNRLTLFARKPAPVQVCYLGYPYSTGLETIDYRLSDAHLDPPGAIAPGPEEVALLESYFCYRPPDDAPDVNPELPSRARVGAVTFGSMNQMMKINPQTLDAWVRVMRSIDGSRLLVKSQGLSDLLAHEPMLTELRRRGIERVELAGNSPLAEAMGQMSCNVDIALDTFPYPGGTTSCHLLWAGVPVVTLEGALPIHRLGATVLRTIGLGELVARDIDDFVQIAIDLANDEPRRVELRATLRDRMRTSPLMDPARFVRKLESLYRQMWQRWIAT